MLSPSEKKTLNEYIAELKEASAERYKLTQRINRLEAAARSILATTEDESEIVEFQGALDEVIEPTGFTDAIRKVLQAANGEILTPTEIKDRLPAAGFRLSGYSNPLASIHTILKRMSKNESAYRVESVIANDKAGYRWVTPGALMLRDLLGASEKSKIQRPQERFNLKHTKGK